MGAFALPNGHTKAVAIGAAVDDTSIGAAIAHLLLGHANHAFPIPRQLVFPAHNPGGWKPAAQLADHLGSRQQLGQERAALSRDFGGFDFFEVAVVLAGPDFAKRKVADGRGVKNCVGQMDNAGVVTLLGYSVAAGCTSPNFIIKPTYTGAGAQFRDDQIRRPPFYQFDLNFAKVTKITDTVKLQIRFELYNVFNQAIYDERQYENNPTNPLFGTIDRTVVRQSNFPRYGQLGIKLLF